MLELATCLLLAVLYVASLYIWNSEHNRDHPTTIKKRFVSVSVIMLIAPIFLYLHFREDITMGKVTLWQLLGIRSEKLGLAFLLPLLLTVLLFLGPISIQIKNGVWRIYVAPAYWFNSFRDLIWIRNHIVAPLSEEFTYRACMMPVLLLKFSTTTTILITPLFFGVAHLHHMAERIRSGIDKRTAIIISTFQFVYTTIFGIYSAYLFVRTGHFMAPFIAHAFCNHMGFPDVNDLVSQPEPQRKIFCGLYILGLIGFLTLAPVLSNPKIYAHNLYDAYV
uniref:CAAX prenyl protease 2 n=1 Tax=Culicoides sonorensis TaxID=179676 RepID=A0A336M742_CULSO